MIIIHDGTSFRLTYVSCTHLCLYCKRLCSLLRYLNVIRQSSKTLIIKCVNLFTPSTNMCIHDHRRTGPTSWGGGGGGGSCPYFLPENQLVLPEYSLFIGRIPPRTVRLYVHNKHIHWIGNISKQTNTHTHTHTHTHTCTNISIFIGGGGQRQLMGKHTDKIIFNNTMWFYIENNPTVPTKYPWSTWAWVGGQGWTIAPRAPPTPNHTVAMQESYNENALKVIDKF